VSLAAVLLVAIVAVLVPVAVLRPWIGFLAYTWVSFMVPHRLIGGAVSDLPFAKVVAIATLIGVLFTGERFALPRRRELAILVAFWVVCVASTVLVAQQPQRAWLHLQEFTKVVLMTVVALMLFRDRDKIRIWLLVIALSIGALGIIGSIEVLRTGFAAILFGPRSAFGDNNSLGFVLAMVVPLLAFLAIGAGRSWLAKLLLVGFFCALVSIVATYSRGSLIVLCVVLPLILLLVPRKELLAMTCLAALVVAAVTPMQWSQRMATITPTAYRDTSSGSQRMKSWYVAWRVGVDHPLLGAGFRPFAPELYARYMPGYSDYHDAHNHFLQVLAEHGFSGLILFVALLASVIASAWRTAFGPAADPALAWTRPVARMTLLSVVAYLVGGMFLNLPYFEPLYQLIAVIVLVDDMAHAPPAQGAAVRARPIAALLVDRVRSR
jgi:probable O-glycosylation ligase (exosortase A-associated)